jgi:hypothetical protein
MQNQVVGPGSGRHMAVIAGKSAAFKEKFVSLYEDIFALRSVLQTAKDQGIQGHTAIARFWDELLLLKVNEAFLSRCISQASEEQLRGNLQPVINDIFATCVRCGEHCKSLLIVTTDFCDCIHLFRQSCCCLS